MVEVKWHQKTLDAECTITQRFSGCWDFFVYFIQWVGISQYRIQKIKFIQEE